MSVSRLILIFWYALLPVVFIGGNLLWHLPAIESPTRWPKLQPTAPVAGHPGPAKLDIALLKQSINRLPMVSLSRQIGNSLRIACGQQLSWCLWGNTHPPMLFLSAELWASEGLAPPENQAMVEGALSTIRKYHEVLKQEGWTLVVVPVPSKLSIYHDRCDWPVMGKDLLTRHPVTTDRADEIYDRLVAELGVSRIPVLDLRALYRAHRVNHPTDLLYPPGESHWSGLGLKLAADATAELVSSVTGIRHRQFRPSYLEVEEVADMAGGFNPLPQWTSRLSSIYKYQDHLVNGDEGRGFIYPQNPTSLLVAVGTSYTGQFTWHIGQPVGFAWVMGTQLEECEFQNGAEAGHGSYAAFDHFLAERQTKADEFARRRQLTHFPKVVVWEFPVRDLAALCGR